ncbi:MAG: GxxExxY protein [Planctomycetes bacterium]|nr:GxxExxY protein [Planctomycetota bacterium]
MSNPPTLLSKELSAEMEQTSHQIIGCAIEVHRNLGPGLLESIYQQALVYELRQADLSVQQQVEIKIPYKNTTLGGQRLDILVEHSIVLELKSIETILPVHRAQLLSYLRAGGFPLGLLINFNRTQLKEGLVRVFNERVLKNAQSPSRSSRPSR